MKTIGVAIALCALFAHVSLVEWCSHHYKIKIDDGAQATAGIICIILLVMLGISLGTS